MSTQAFIVAKISRDKTSEIFPGDTLILYKSTKKIELRRDRWLLFIRQISNGAQTHRDSITVPEEYANEIFIYIANIITAISGRITSYTLEDTEAKIIAIFK